MSRRNPTAAAADLTVIELSATPELRALHQLNPQRYPFLLQSTASSASLGHFDILFAFPGRALVLESPGKLSSSVARTDKQFLPALDRWRDSNIISSSPERLLQVRDGVVSTRPIAGCPKVRRMEIIAELESGARGAYAGSFDYLNRDGSLDLNILIRTMVMHGSQVTSRAGSGIVANSEPQAESCVTQTTG